jgi:hypothetical protein
LRVQHDLCRGLCKVHFAVREWIGNEKLQEERKSSNNARRRVRWGNAERT